MQMPISSLLLHHFFFFFLLLTLNNLAPVTGQCFDDQKALLLELKSELVFDSSTSQKLVQWNQTRDCCSWLGVECDGAGRVISLQLDDDSISGGLNGSSSLLRLLYLKKLNLAYNDFSGSQIPRGIHRLLHLEQLNLSHAGFGGEIPIEVSLLKRLLVLDLSFQSFLLHIEHPSWKAVVQNLTRLREVYLDGVDVSAAGSEWSMPITSSLLHLSILSLRGCMLSGPFHPSPPQLHSLTVLQLDRNNLSSAIPDSYANFSSLTAFTCQDCSLLGSLPKMLLQIPTLQELDLSSNLLLGGAISPLSRGLRSIHMSSCSFDGAFPSTLANLTELVSLDLSFNHLTGSIPSLNMLKNLTDIDLSWNSLKGEIYVHHFDGLSNLVFVSLQQNSLSGTIPHNLFGLPSLQQLDLSYNQFSGHVNEFSISMMNISSLEYLLLSNNQLEGPIPNSLSLLQSLLLLDLSYNSFNGTFRLEKLQMIPTLSDLYLSYNSLSVDASNISSSASHGFPQLRTLSLASCDLREFPDFIKHQSSLELLDLSNNRIAGDIPSWIWGVGNGSLMRLNLSRNLLDDLQKPYHIPTSLDRLDLHSNQLKGEFPPLPPSAQHVDYSNNYFSHPIPPNFFASSSNIYFISLASNRLTGAIPTSLCNATILEVLDLSFNNLSSTIPACVAEKMQHLRVLSLRGNNINGAIPTHFSVNCSLRTLDLSDNNLGGEIPKSLANCESLAVLNVGYNNFDDSFPCMLSPSLHVLLLRSNKFHGELGCEKSWPNLQIVDVSSNDFNGSLHLLNFSTWRGMMIQLGDGHLRPNHSSSNLLGNWYSSYQDEVTLIIKGLEMNLSKIWPEFTSIDLSCNNFQGDIPDAIGDLTSLYLLNLSHNALSGTIPKAIGALKELGALDLSENQLRGGIPEELARLTFLSILNVSYNELVGMIPTGPQFRTFEAESFEGNAGLCGFPLNTSCENDSNPPKEKDEDEEEEEIKWEYVCAALGYAVGLGSISWILLFWRRFRDA